eukprot:g24781.t1
MMVSRRILTGTDGDPEPGGDALGAGQRLWAVPAAPSDRLPGRSGGDSMLRRQCRPWGGGQRLLVSPAALPWPRGTGCPSAADHPENTTPPPPPLPQGGGSKPARAN